MCRRSFALEPVGGSPKLATECFSTGSAVPPEPEPVSVRSRRELLRWEICHDLGDGLPDFSGINFRSSYDGRALPSEDELLRPGVHEVENQGALRVLMHVGVGHRCTAPHLIGAVPIRPAATVTVPPVSVSLHGDFFTQEDMASDGEIGPAAGRLPNPSGREFRAQ